jgi:hypothetical protein
MADRAENLEQGASPLLLIRASSAGKEDVYLLDVGIVVTVSWTRKLQ